MRTEGLMVKMSWVGTTAGKGMFIWYLKVVSTQSTRS
jgi:hypothetical protein